MHTYMSLAAAGGGGGGQLVVSYHEAGPLGILDVIIYKQSQRGAICVCPRTLLGLGDCYFRPCSSEPPVMCVTCVAVHMCGGNWRKTCWGHSSLILQKPARHKLFPQIYGEGSKYWRIKTTYKVVNSPKNQVTSSGNVSTFRVLAFDLPM